MQPIGQLHERLSLPARKNAKHAEAYARDSFQLQLSCWVHDLLRLRSENLMVQASAVCLIDEVGERLRAA